MIIEDERLRQLTHDVWLKLKKEKQEIGALRESRRGELLKSVRGFGS